MAFDKWIDYAEDVPSKWRQRTRGRYVKGAPEGLVVHFTAGHHNQKPNDALALAKKSGMSYLLLDRDGILYQSTPLTHWGYHSGDTKKYASAWPGLGFGVSDRLVGVEVMCAGKLDNNRKAWFSKSPYPESECRKVGNNDNQQAGWYHRYTPEQEQALFKLCRWLKEHSDGVFQYKYVLGHDEVSGKRGIGRSRKNDPGGSFSMTMDAFRERLMIGESDSPFTEVPDASPIVIRPRDDANHTLLVAGLTKEQFFDRNKGTLQAWIDDANRGKQRELTLADLIIVGYLEAGLTRGQVDPNHSHKPHGERGIFPWPSRMAGWDQPMTAKKNVQGFIKYLAEEKNSSTYGQCYDSRSPRQGSLVLAAIIHGWGYQPNFSSPEDAYRQAIAELAAHNDSAAIHRVLDIGGYKNAGLIVTNRLTNIERASSLT